MKKYMGMFLIAVTLSAGFLSLPEIAGKLIAPVEVVYPAQTVFSDKLYVSGTVEEIIRKDVLVELPVIPSAVYVLAGDSVAANELLAEVDIPATRQAILSLLETAGGLTPETLSAFGGLIGSEAIAGAAASLTGAAGLEPLQEALRAGVDETALDGLLPSEIRAPAAGTITSINMTPGAVSLPKIPVCSISRTDTLQAKMSMPEADAAKVSEGDEVLFTSPATGSKKFAGTVSRVFPAAAKTLVGTSQQTTVGFYVALPANCGDLKPGYTVDGIVRVGREETTLAIPYEAVRQDADNQEYVYIFEKNRAVRRDIITGRELASGVAVAGGLTAEDAVIRDAASIPYENSWVSVRH